MRLDVNAWIGHYPFRPVTGGSPSGLIEGMDRTGIARAWISNLAAVFWTDPAAGNEVLYRCAREESRLAPVPAIHPGWPDWKSRLEEAISHGAPAVRADPGFYGLDPAGPEMRALGAACAEAGLPLVMATRLEDGRQRHPHDRAAELDAAAIRALLRSHPGVRLIVTHADRDIIEQVHFGSTPEEAGRILWDICWLWGPPEDHLALLLETVGVERFTFGTGMPFRIPETSVAKLDLLDLPAGARARIEHGNLSDFLTVPSR
jgi:predicted TIM-barrel fold metal-dependent hydrolase